MTNKFYIGWDDFYAHVRLLAQKIQKSGQKFDKIIAVSRGGLLPAGILSYELEIRHCETINIATYDDNKQRDESEIELAAASFEINERSLIVDDISDSGRTFRILRKYYPDACYATVYVKAKGKDMADVFTVEIPDDWVVFPWDR